MDDTLEQPNTPFVKPGDEEHEQDSSGDEDGGLDWTKLPLGNNAARPVIPKRGEKDFEPSGSERARLAMFDALRSTRAISRYARPVSYAVWYPDLARAHVTVARGVHFTSMGHSVQRPSKVATKTQKRLELLPEEALYLVEKGALFCWKATRGAPMSVQQAYAEMIGTQDLTLDRYHTFSYLRRLGYIVARARPPSPAYPVPAAQALSQQAHHGLRSFAGQTTPYRKTAPPQPDFSIVVVNARTTPMPTLAEFSHMYEGLPTIPPPVPRSRKAPPATNTSVSKPSPPTGTVVGAHSSFLTKFLSYFLFRSTQSPPVPAPVKPNPFMALRQGKKIVIVAAVDAGIVSFFRFGEGAFEEWPMA
ncbi:tRNA-splicing endonuclease subunit sen54 N-term-domain-containing protein [Lactarius sanguifluus]|nr:tRNA-splicing endonuclease subunit sen54 N-term-domain-containing protein [Lactarius sanguifluus]